jgi:pimeloyl-ACP methyl ester carboxylesterase
MPVIEIDGSGLNVLDVGQGDAVLLGHGFMADGGVWGPQLAALARTHRVIVPDLWGHGESGALPWRTRNFRDIARQHLLLMDKLGIGAFAFAGMALGGVWGVEMALLAPERVRGLALLGTWAGAEPPESRARYAAITDSVAAAGSIMPPVADAIVSLFFSAHAERAAPHQLERFRDRLISWNRARLADSLVPLARMICQRRDALSELADLTMLALVMTGTDDVPCPPPLGRRMAELLRCPFVEIQAAGHIATLEQPAFVSEQLLGFLREVERAAPSRKNVAAPLLSSGAA